MNLYWFTSRTQINHFTNLPLPPSQSSAAHSPPHSSSLGDLGLTGLAIKEEKKKSSKPGVTNVRGIINDVIRDASAEIGTVGPQVMSFIRIVCLTFGSEIICTLCLEDQII